jgi:hypothetical protein
VAITNGYCSLSELKAALRITDNVDDSLLEMAVESASRAIDGHAGRYFYSAGTATRVFPADDYWVCQIDDLAGTAVTIQIDDDANGTFDETFQLTDYQLEPVNGIVDGLQVPYTRIRAIGDYNFPTLNEEALVKVTGVFGWPSIPVAIKQACIIQSSRIFKRLDSPLGVAGFGDMGAVRVSRYLDPDVEQLVAPYRRMRNFL